MKNRLLFLILLIFGFANAQVTVQTVSTVTGSSQGDAIGSSSVAQFWGPYGIASNANLGITDTNNNKIKYVYTDNSTVLLAGSTSGFVNGTGAAARFNNPTGIARLMFNDFVVCDTGNNAIRRVSTSFPLGVTTTIAGNSGTQGYVDGPASTAQFNQPYGIAVNTANDDIYIADTYNHVIRKLSGTTVSTFAGSTQGYTDATGTAAQFDTPIGLVLDSNKNVFVIDKARIRKITPAGVVTTFAGSSTAGYLDGTGTSAQFANGMSGITIDANNNLYVTDTGNLRVRKITPAGVVTTFAGTGVFGSADGEGSVATFSYFGGISYHIGGGPFKLNIADGNNNRIRSITSVTANVPTITGVSSSSITSTAATINYSLNANNGSTSSVIKYGLASNNLTSQVSGFSATGSSTNAGTGSITGLLSNTQYFYQIEATNVAGTSTSTGNFTTTGPPAMPTISAISANTTFNSATINYSLNANNAATASVVKYGLTSSNLSSQESGFSATSNTITPGSVSITGLLANTQYFYQIEATNSVGTSNNGTVLNFTTPATPPAIAEYSFNNTYNNTNGNTPFANNSGTSFVLGRDGITANGALNINNTGTTATILNLPYGTDARTVSVWVKLNSLNVSNFNYIYHYGTASNGNGAYLSGTNSIHFATSPSHSVATTVATNVWYHYVFMYDGINSKIYRNGTLLQTSSRSWSTINNSNIFKLGLTESNGVNYFNGAIDDLKIYNYALSDSEVSSLYNTNSLGIQDFNTKNLQLSLYPNPVKDYLNIETTDALKSVTIYGLLGNKIMESNSNQVNVSQLSKGIYMVRVEDVSGKIATKKIAKE